MESLVVLLVGVRMTAFALLKDHLDCLFRGLSQLELAERKLSQDKKDLEISVLDFLTQTSCINV